MRVKLRIDWALASNQYRTKHRYAPKHLIIAFREIVHSARGIFGYKIKRRARAESSLIETRMDTATWVGKKIRTIFRSTCIYALITIFFSTHLHLPRAELCRDNWRDRGSVQVVMLQIQRITEMSLRTMEREGGRERYNCYYRTRDYHAVTIAGINAERAADVHSCRWNKFFRTISPAQHRVRSFCERYRATPARNQKSRTRREFSRDGNSRRI